MAAVALLGGWAAAKPGDLRLVTPRGRSMPPPWQRWAEASLMPTVRGRVIVMNNGDRGRFRRIFRQPRRRAWWKGSIPLAEQFAEAYSFCARYRRIVSIARFATYDYRPSRRQHEAVCKLIRDAARDRAPSTPPADTPPVTRSDPVPPPQPPSSPGTVPYGPAPSPTPQPKPTPTPGPLPIPPLPTPPPLP